MMTDRMKLEPDRWYGWTMTPGYGDIPYHSPILVDEVIEDPADPERIRLKFLNLFYAAGVQDFEKDLSIKATDPDRLTFSECDMPERTIAIEPLTLDWMREHLGEEIEYPERFFNEHGEPISDNLHRLAPTAY